MSDPIKIVFANFDLRGIILASNTKRIVEEMLSAHKARFASVVRDVRVYGEAYDAFLALCHDNS